MKSKWIWPNLHIYIARTCKRSDWILVTLTSFSRSHEGLDCWKMTSLRPISWMNGWILTKHIYLYCCNLEKNWLDFGDLDPIFKVALRLILLENGLSAPCPLKEWVDFDQTYTLIKLYCWDMQITVIFGDLDPISKVTEVLDCWKMACLHPISWRNGWI